jgi:penicillin-binding protein 1A
MRALRLLGRALAALLVLAVISAGVGAVLYRLYVIDAPGDHISRDHILTLIGQESLVTFRDGETPIGAFFDDEHRQYVAYDRIPKAWVDAITSSEDQRYFEHFGIDLWGLARAMNQNVRAGQMVSGGSTLTMQTAENLFRPGTRDVTGKLYELVDTLRLEAHFSKEEILEFYANQFHVYGNGRGLGIAARYFFDKEVEELDVQECAFLAGLVKIPGRYNPFIGATEAERELAKQKAQTRTRYVMGRMLEDGKIDEQTYDSFIDRPLPFKKGEFRFDRSVLMDEVERQIEAEPFTTLFTKVGIVNPSSAGLRIITTLDADAQRASTYALWHHLTEVGPALEGATPKSFVQNASLAPIAETAKPPVPYELRYAKVRSHAEHGVVLDLGVAAGLIDKAGMDRAAQVLAVAQKGDRYAKADATLRQSLKDTLAPGAVVWVSVRAVKDKVALCDLELRPTLQGATVVLREGEILAMVGGNDNKNFNRVTTAKRQLGSTWKVLVYNAALQLGWAPTDALDNRRGVFPFSGSFYYPKADHEPEDFVSLNWAGVRSENLATIWLLAHLVDRLNDEQLRRLAERVDLAQRPDEDRAAYITRIRDVYGVIATEDRKEEALLHSAKESVLGELSFLGHPEDALELRSLHYGRGFEKEMGKVRGGKDAAAKLAALEMNLKSLEELAPRCEAAVSALTAGQTSGVAPSASAVSLLSTRPADGQLKLACGRVGEGWAPVAESLLGRLNEPGLPTIDDDPALHGRLHLSTLTALRAALNDQLTSAAGLDPYDDRLLYGHPDFRAQLGMRTIAGLAKALGVETELPSVMSLPLGAADITLLEAARMYQGFLKGEAWTTPGDGEDPTSVTGILGSFELPAPAQGLLLVREIQDREGRTIYKARPTATQVADPIAGRLTLDILRNVVLHGTGRRAIEIAKPSPLGGKTGTTNDYKNSAFIGYAPIWREDGYDPTESLTVASYVGYDDNRSMSRGSTRLQGASGALPAWAGAIEAMAAMGLLGEPPADAKDAEVDDELVRVSVSEVNGLPTAPGAPAGEGASVLVLAPADNPSRRFAPFGARAQAAEAPLEPPPLDLAQPLGEAAPIDTGGVEEPRLGTPPSVWDEIEDAEVRPEPSTEPSEPPPSP